MPPSTEELDHLLPRLALGDDAVAARVYDLSAPAVQALSISFLRPGRAAEEACLEIYAEVWRRAASFDPSRGSGMTWILTLARCVCLDRLRRDRVRSNGVHALLAEPSAAAGCDPAARLQHDERRVLLRRALDALPPDQRRALETAYYGSLSYREAALALGVPEGTIKARIRAALGTLRRELSPPAEMEG